MIELETAVIVLGATVLTFTGAVATGRLVPGPRTPKVSVRLVPDPKDWPAAAPPLPELADRPAVHRSAQAASQAQAVSPKAPRIFVPDAKPQARNQHGHWASREDTDAALSANGEAGTS